MNLLEVKNLKVYFTSQYGVAAAVDDVSFDLSEGETLGIVGESGSGKSVTFLSMLQLLDKSTKKTVEGEIIFDNESLLEMNNKDMQKIRGNKVSMIFQEPMTALNPVFTVGQQIIEVYQTHQNMDKKEALKQSVNMLKMVGIPSPEQRVHEYPHQLSGGMRQRVMIAIALACKPKLLVADEPTTALDVTIQAQILRLMKDLKKQLGTAIVLITHDLGVVSKMSDKVAVMYAGQIVEYGTREDIFEGTLHPYTIALKKSLPSIKEDVEILQSISGLAPNIYNRSSGCRFHPRCECAKKICKNVEPELVNFNNHLTRCLKYSVDWEMEE
jgi:peptide/nickel transport system ATP-binding protein